MKKWFTDIKTKISVVQNSFHFENISLKNPKIAILSIFVVCSLMLSPLLAYGLVIPMSTDEVLEELDVIVLGQITNVASFEDRPQEFQIAIEQVIKPHTLEKETITAIGCSPNSRNIGTLCPSYDLGDRGLFLIVAADNDYQLSSGSRISKATCTSQEFLASYRGFEPHFFWTQNEQSDRFFTENPMTIHFVISNFDLMEKEYSIQLSSHTHEFGFSDTVNGIVPQCVGHETVSVSFVPPKMGTYGFNSRYDGGGDGSFGTAIIDFGSTPKQQFDAGIHAQDVWCKDNLQLILKNDKTKPRADNSPACVSENTAIELIKRNWGFVPP